MASAGALNITEFRKRVEAFLHAVPGEVLRINQGLAVSVIPLITGRIINEGKDATGKQLGTYSNNPLPLFFFQNKSTGVGAERKIDSLVKSKKKALATGEKFRGVSYAEFRQANNLPTDHVTLSFTGETLGDIGVIDEKVENRLVRTTIGAKNTKTKAKYNAKGQRVGENKTEQILDYLGERYGEDILAATPEEEKILADAFDDELQIFINKYF